MKHTPHIFLLTNISHDSLLRTLSESHAFTPQLLEVLHSLETGLLNASFGSKIRTTCMDSTSKIQNARWTASIRHLQKTTDHFNISEMAPMYSELKTPKAISEFETRS